MNIFDTARQLAAQKSITFTTALSQLSRRRRRRGNYGKTTVQPGAFANIERPANYRLPYNDN